MARPLLSEWEKQFNKNLRNIKTSIRNLEKMNLKIEIAKDVETMFGTIVDHVYVIDYLGERVILQKHLFSVNQ